MGLLVEGEAFSPEETKDKLNYIREHAITQFLTTWNRVKNLEGDELRFGDEIECGIFVIDHEKKTIKLAVRSAEIRAILDERELKLLHESEGCTWHPEFGGWMIESTPSRPYTNYVSELLRVERNMTLRRRRLLSVLRDNEIAPTVTNFPLLGVNDTIHDPKPFSAPHSKSDYLPDYVINPHPRFAALTNNILHRRESKVNILVPLFHDVHTPEFLDTIKSDSISTVEDNSKFIHMDCMAFGMGMCCLVRALSSQFTYSKSLISAVQQVTFQARDVDESRYMYDQLAVLAPIMLAMTAASPIYKGRLSDVDARWNIIAQSVDDRTPAERGLLSPKEIEKAIDPRMAGNGVKRLQKSRYDSISTFIYHCNGDASCSRTFEEYNDIPCPVDEPIKERLRSEGIDENLAHHIAHLFTRDPIVAFKGQIEELDDSISTDHFESVQSTNWQTCRWKPPPPRLSSNSPHIGWRTEFRSMEVQLTDFENAAFTVFIILITRVVLAFDLALYIPLSKVDANMQRAQVRDGIHVNKFYFRKFVAPPSESELHAHTVSSEVKSTGDLNSMTSSTSSSSISQMGICSTLKNYKLAPNDLYEEMTMNEIFNGKGTYYPGLIPLVYAYLEYIKCDASTFKRLDEYLTFIKRRASGELLTPATWMRRFVQKHPAYKKDSVISSEIAFDLMVTCKGIGEGTIQCPELLGTVHIDQVRKEDAYGQLLAGRLTTAERSELMKMLVSRATVQRPSHVARGQSRSLSRQLSTSSDSGLRSHTKLSTDSK